jgi:DNA helicase MCM8
MVCRIGCVSPLTPLCALKSATVGKFVSVRGNVVRVSAVRPLVRRMAFMCGKCNAETSVPFTQGKFDTPQRCADAGCRSRAFTPLFATAEAVDYQKIRIQVRRGRGGVLGVGRRG